jgi:hypothetical protein
MNGTSLRPLAGALMALAIGLLPARAGAEDLKAILDRYVAAYPEHLAGHDGAALIFKDGTRMPARIGAPGRSFEQLLRDGDLVDQVSIAYVAGPPGSNPTLNQDPGRIRHEPFFLKVYGDCRKGEVQKRMKRIVWLPKSLNKTVEVTAVNGVAERLERVSAELDTLPPALRKHLWPLGGILNCRPVADTGKLSMHAFGAAIDISTAVSDYWFWARKKGEAGPIPYRNRVPFEIVRVFEKYGFIWGGKWYHYDTMHFEYRPELLMPST